MAVDFDGVPVGIDGWNCITAYVSRPTTAAEDI